MGKIKGWKKERHSGNVWRNEEYRNVGISIEGHKRMGYAVHLVVNSRLKPISKSYDEEAKAVKFATQYMRSHPRG